MEKERGKQQMLADWLGGVEMGGNCKGHPLGWIELELTAIDVRIAD